MKNWSKKLQKTTHWQQGTSTHMMMWLLNLLSREHKSGVFGAGLLVCDLGSLGVGSLRTLLVYTSFWTYDHGIGLINYV